MAAPLPVDATGAAGAAGVEVDAWAGVAGGAAAGAGFSALGCWRNQSRCSNNSEFLAHLVHHADNIALLFDVVGTDCLVILQDLACTDISRLSQPWPIVS